MSNKPQQSKPLDELLDQWRRIAATIEPQPDQEPQDTCDTCHGMGQIIPVVNGKRLNKMVPCPSCEKGQRLRHQMLENRVKRTQIPRRYANATLDGWLALDHPMARGKIQAYLAMTEFVDTATHHVSQHAVARTIRDLYREHTPQWVLEMLDAPDSVRPGIVLYGDYGVGKTWLAAAAMNDLGARGEYVLYMRMSTLVQTLRDTWKSDEKTGELLEHYCTVPILFIDDMSDNSGTEKPLPPHQQEFAATIMRSRMGDELPTLVTTNWPPDLFTHKWGEVATEVMLEGLHWIRMGGEKLRDVRVGWGEL